MTVVEAIIDGLSVDGKGVVHVEDRACFVPGGLPGDRVKLELDFHAKPPSGRIVELLAPSPQRVAHPCPHADLCQGSLWGGLSYDMQLQAKRDLVARTLRHVLPNLEIPPVVPSPRQWNYRSRATLNLWLDQETLRAGFSREARSPIGIPIHTCSLCMPAVDSCLQQLPCALAKFADVKPTSRAHRLQVHLTQNGAGLLLVLEGPVARDDLRFWSAHLSPLPSGGLWLAAGTRAGIVRSDSPFFHSANALPMLTTWLGHRLELHPATFCQVNAFAAELVENFLAQFAADMSPTAVFDLYGGFGALGFAAARQCPLTIFDITPHSAETTRTLSALTGNTQADFVAGDLLATLPHHSSRLQRDDLILLDPPRRGAHEKVLTLIARSKARHVVYLSCNPACLARDLAFLTARMFHVKHLQPFDFFPQTPRIEVLAILERE